MGQKVHMEKHLQPILVVRIIRYHKRLGTCPRMLNSLAWIAGMRYWHKLERPCTWHPRLTNSTNSSIKCIIMRLWASNSKKTLLTKVYWTCAAAGEAEVSTQSWSLYSCFFKSKLWPSAGVWNRLQRSPNLDSWVEVPGWRDCKRESSLHPSKHLLES